MCRDMGREQREERGETILVSACLLGEKCKYSGESNYCQSVVDYLKITGAPSVRKCWEDSGRRGHPLKSGMKESSQRTAAT